ncbi:PDZ domain-containing protein [Enterococcus saccharolyticus]|uniref:endopeptidase La n=1 Tax=Candidatus Enterococcus willemsii TaxID=1857215 RepID=A0ABQ6YXP8_9ENTE|nr:MULTISPECIES: SepM family pheromone-processing serine protease [Enterococcus]KAF1302756.1 peptidase [Enterococcus sp. CU12B]MCD5002434.1 PDZ domain-containing protein [Enterococcus saccharolyticus]
MKKTSIKYFLLFIVATVIAACVFVPIPYYIEKPGSTIDLKQLVTVNGNEDKQPGSFSLTSVGVQQATVLTALKSKFSSFEQLVSEEEMFGGSSGEEYDQIQRYYMESSQNNAIEQALKQAGRPYDFEYKGVYVMSVEPKSNFYHDISVGDTVTQVDGKHFENNQEFIDYVQNKKVDDEVTITFIHQNKQKQATGKLIELSTKKPGIGITLVDHTEIESDDKIDFHVENIGGPSAGLMFTLEIYEQLTKQDLRKGKKIAGTGTINNEGEVGRIGGIDKKVASADQEGMEIFFAPDDELTAEEKAAYPELQSNYEEAKAAAEKIHSKMKIVPVKTLQDALDYLENM